MSNPGLTLKKGANDCLFELLDCFIMFDALFMPISLMSQYGLQQERCIIQPYGNGLIHHTWKITQGESEYILQKINHQIFKQPFHIIENMNRLCLYLKKNYPEYLFVSPLTSENKEDFIYDPNKGYFRMFPYVKNSYTCDIVSNKFLAFEAAQQFGRFTKILCGFDPEELHITLPDFHNLSLRYRQFELATEQGNADRIAIARESVDLIKEHKIIAETFDWIKTNSDFKIRVTHHDTKISNVLFRKADGKGLCVIDLDTVMPGYFISDVGDMMRTYLSPVSEEEKDFSKIEIREEYFFAILRGYLGEMHDELSVQEKQHFVYAGKFMIYMQAIRFLTDYLNNDMYYGSKYENHNLIRANNQLVLLQRLIEKEQHLTLRSGSYLKRN